MIRDAVLYQVVHASSTGDGRRVYQLAIFAIREFFGNAWRLASIKTVSHRVPCAIGGGRIGLPCEGHGVMTGGLLRYRRCRKADDGARDWIGRCRFRVFLRRRLRDTQGHRKRYHQDTDANKTGPDDAGPAAQRYGVSNHLRNAGAIWLDDTALSLKNKTGA